jgi:hypothetical protein
MPIELRTGLTPEEYALLEAFDFENRDEVNWIRQLTKEQAAQWETVRRSQVDLEGSTWVIDAWRVDHPVAIARFLATVEGPVPTSRPPRDPDHRIVVGSVWYLAGYLGRTDSDDEAVTHLAIEAGRSFAEMGVTSDVMRAISTADLLAKVQAFLRAKDTLDDLVEAWGVPDVDELADLRKTAHEARRMQLHRGSGGFPDAYYRGLAWDYLEQKSGRRGVLARLARMYEREQRVIRDHLHRAKVRGFLAGGVSGKLSYVAGPNLYEKGNKK